MFSLEDQVQLLKGEIQGLRSLLASTRGELRELRQIVVDLQDKAELGGTFSLVSEVRLSDADIEADRSRSGVDPSAPRPSSAPSGIDWS